MCVPYFNGTFNTIKIVYHMAASQYNDHHPLCVISTWRYTIFLFSVLLSGALFSITLKADNFFYILYRFTLSCETLISPCNVIFFFVHYQNFMYTNHHETLFTVNFIHDRVKHFFLFYSPVLFFLVTIILSVKISF